MQQKQAGSYFCGKGVVTGKGQGASRAESILDLVVVSQMFCVVSH